MILDIIRNVQNGLDPRIAIVDMLLLIPVLLISLTVHEYSHGRAALAIGDKTALMAGRLTLNPLRHLDPIGALMLLLVGFGYAKPVPINPRNFDKVGYKKGLVIVSLAGPLSNFLLALIGVLGTHIVVAVIYAAGVYNVYLELTYTFFYYFAALNVGLGVFNLIPIPPLDGSRILTIFLPAKAQVWFFRYERYIQLIIFILIWRGILDTPLNFLRNIILVGMDKLVSLIPFL